VTLKKGKKASERRPQRNARNRTVNAKGMGGNLGYPPEEFHPGEGGTREKTNTIRGVNLARHPLARAKDERSVTRKETLPDNQNPEGVKCEGGSIARGGGENGPQKNVNRPMFEGKTRQTSTNTPAKQEGSTKKKKKEARGHSNKGGGGGETFFEQGGGKPVGRGGKKE